MEYKKIKGTLDFFGVESEKIRYVEKISKSVALSYNLEEMITPIIEQTEVFSRSSGDSSDIVTKEMYTFLDKGNRSITLRPEGTASIVRSFLENSLYIDNGVKKYFYRGPMFRYERPQAGRYREFRQFGVEFFGEPSYLMDAEVIMLGDSIFKKLGLQGKYRVCINTIGDFESRKNYSAALKNYFSLHINELCDDCKRRLEKNPMRILDCKIDKNSIALNNAPKIADYLTLESKEYFKNLQKVLDKLKIDYYIDDNLVRGLDYYTDTVFEFIINGDENDSEKSLKGLAMCAGGRYAGLTKLMGGPDIPGIGFAFGIERAAYLLSYYKILPDLENKVDVVIIGLDIDSKILGLKIANELRSDGLNVEMDYKNIKLKPQFKLADKTNARFIIIIGETERINNEVTIKDHLLNTQETIQINNLKAYLNNTIKKEID